MQRRPPRLQRASNNARRKNAAHRWIVPQHGQLRGFGAQGGAPLCRRGDGVKGTSSAPIRTHPVWEISRSVSQRCRSAGRSSGGPYNTYEQVPSHLRHRSPVGMNHGTTDCACTSAQEHGLAPSGRGGGLAAAHVVLALRDVVIAVLLVLRLSTLQRGAGSGLPVVAIAGGIGAWLSWLWPDP